MSSRLLSYPGGSTQQGTHMADKYLVAYAKIMLDKDDGISLAGVFIGGIGDSKEEADGIARDVVNTVPRGGGTIIPRVTKLVGDGQVIDAMYDATEKFERVVQSMVESDQIISRGRRKS